MKTGGWFANILKKKDLERLFTSKSPMIRVERQIER